MSSRTPEKKDTAAIPHARHWRAHPIGRVGSSGSTDETTYLMSNPKNARRLREAIANVQAGNVIERDLIE